jgi:hypothetical protein
MTPATGPILLTLDYSKTYDVWKTSEETVQVEMSKEESVKT